MSQLSDSNRIKVIQSCQTWLPQTQIWLYNQVRYLPSNIENYIICTRRENVDYFDLPNIYFLEQESKLKDFLTKVLLKLKIRKLGTIKQKERARLKNLLEEIANREKVQVLHSHFGNVGWENLNIARKADLKHIVTFYGYDINYIPSSDPIWFQRYKSLFEEVDLILCEGSYMSKSIEKLGCPKDKIKVHHLGISTEEIKFEPRKWNPKNPLRILIAASFAEKKGIPYALEALGRLQHEVDLEVTIIGDARNAPRTQAEKQKILATINKYDLKSRVRLLGYQPHNVLLKEAYQHHIFISPSITSSDGDTEGGVPVSIIEMAATGMPIVSTTHCDIPEVVLDGVTGFLAKERDVDGLIKNLTYLISHSESWNEMLALGRKHVEQEYNAQKQGFKLAEIYRELRESPNRI